MFITVTASAELICVISTLYLAVTGLNKMIHKHYYTLFKCLYYI